MSWMFPKNSEIMIPTIFQFLWYLFRPRKLAHADCHFITQTVKWHSYMINRNPFLIFAKKNDWTGFAVRCRRMALRTENSKVIWWHYLQPHFDTVAIFEYLRNEAGRMKLLPINPAQVSLPKANKPIQSGSVKALSPRKLKKVTLSRWKSQIKLSGGILARLRDFVILCRHRKTEKWNNQSSRR